MNPIIDANRFMTLATADANGVPWASPVWFARRTDEFLWVSRPDARHSLNIAANPEIAFVIFNSQVRPGDGQAVYVSAVAEELAGDAIDDGIRVFSDASVADGLTEWTRADVTPPARHRLYRATVKEMSRLAGGDRREPL
jgi:nitroimidazol reductase NimA-like FMN-containing flavoprotein (pyridoxamine 5'-phosphate oxidase superfamily)